MKLMISNAVLAAFAAAIAVPAAASVSVSGASSTPTVLATLLAGQTYTITASGVVDLFAVYNAGTGLTFSADGTPTYEFPGTYAPFGTTGSVTDPSNGAHGLAYNFKLGSLVGTFSATPGTGSGSTDFFAIGLGTTITAASNETLYGLVNDTSYTDNGPGAFSVDVGAIESTSSVPEPATWAMMVLGFSLAGAAVRSRPRRTVRFAH